MVISFRMLLVLAKIAKDREAEKALTAYQALTQLADSKHTIRIWACGGSYQVGLSRR